MRVFGVILVALIGLTGCAPKSERVFFNGVYYPAKAKRVKSDRTQFVVSVRRAEKGIDGARLAGIHEGTGYCLKNYGTSEIVWTDGSDAENARLTTSGGKLVLKGKCSLW